MGRHRARLDLPEGLHLHRGPLQFPERSFWRLASEDRSGLSRRGRVTGARRQDRRQRRVHHSLVEKARQDRVAVLCATKTLERENPVEVQGSPASDGTRPRPRGLPGRRRAVLPRGSRRHRARPCKPPERRVAGGSQEEVERGTAPGRAGEARPRARAPAPRERHGRQRERVPRRRLHHPPQPTRRGGEPDLETRISRTGTGGARNGVADRDAFPRRRPARAGAPEGPDREDLALGVQTGRRRPWSLFLGHPRDDRQPASECGGHMRQVNPHPANPSPDVRVRLLHGDSRRSHVRDQERSPPRSGAARHLPPRPRPPSRRSGGAPSASRRDTRNRVQSTRDPPALLAVVGDRESVRLVANPFEEMPRAAVQPENDRLIGAGDPDALLDRSLRRPFTLLSARAFARPTIGTWKAPPPGEPGVLGRAEAAHRR